jgi:alpha-1,2-mannosyltransferase
MSGATVRFWCGALIAFYVALFVRLWMHGPFLHLGDFSMLWAAGRLAATGDAAAAYDWAAIERLQPFAASVHAFFYPPIFLILLAPFGLLPFVMAAVTWLGGMLAAYLAAIRAILPERTALIAALAAPPVLFNLGSGQNGLLLAALLGGGLAMLDARPLLAGILLGASAYKPHFGVLLPLFLALTGRWRVFAAAALTVLALALAAASLFGWSAWAAFVHSIGAANDAFRQQGPLAARMDWPDLASLYGMLRTLGLGPVASWWTHMLVAAAATAACLSLAVARAPEAVKLAALATAMLTVSPYSERSDLALLAPAVAFLVGDGLVSRLPAWQRWVLAGVFLLPLLDWIAHLLARFLEFPRYSCFAGPVACAMLVAVIAGRRRATNR